MMLLRPNMVNLKWKKIKHLGYTTVLASATCPLANKMAMSAWHHFIQAEGPGVLSPGPD